MSYTYPEALDALESIANDYIKTLRPRDNARVTLVCDQDATTASVSWDVYGICIHMPVRAATSVMPQTEFEDWTAYLLHELGHPTHTDKSTWTDAVRQGLGRMVNALEDVRMEKALIASKVVPNAKAVLSRLISRKVAEARANNWNPNARNNFAWTACVLGRAANGYDIDPADLTWIKAQIKPGSTVGTVMAWALPELKACTSTADCLVLAERISKTLGSPQEGPQNDAVSGTGNNKKRTGDASEGQQTASQDEEENKSSEDTAENNKAKDNGEAKNGNEGNEGETGGKGGHGHGDGTTDADELPVKDEDQVEHALAPQGETLTGVKGLNERTVLNILRDNVIQSPPKNPIKGFPGSVAATARLTDIAAKSSRQRALLARALRANETDEREGGRRAGRLDRGALTRAIAGAPNVFAKREITEGYDTDVCILLDASGSMGGYNMISALEVGLVVAQAAASVGACCTTETFNSSGYRRAGGLASKRAPNPADFGALTSSAQGGTPLSAHMARVAVNQAKRAPHKRRVVFIVTDGGCDYGPKTVKRMAKYLEQACGTVLAHVSIGTPLTGAFQAEVYVPSNTPLTSIGLDHFVKVLQAL
jgi:cobaltochelatase CobT